MSTDVIKRRSFWFYLNPFGAARAAYERSTDDRYIRLPGGKVIDRGDRLHRSPKRLWLVAIMGLLFGGLFAAFNNDRVRPIINSNIHVRWPVFGFAILLEWAELGLTLREFKLAKNRNFMRWFNLIWTPLKVAAATIALLGLLGALSFLTGLAAPIILCANIGQILLMMLVKTGIHLYRWSKAPRGSLEARNHRMGAVINARAFLLLFVTFAALFVAMITPQVGAAVIFALGISALVTNFASLWLGIDVIRQMKGADADREEKSRVEADKLKRVSNAELQQHVRDVLHRRTGSGLVRVLADVSDSNFLLRALGTPLRYAKKVQAHVESVGDDSVEMGATGAESAPQPAPISFRQAMVVPEHTSQWTRYYADANYAEPLLQTAIGAMDPLDVLQPHMNTELDSDLPEYLQHILEAMPTKGLPHYLDNAAAFANAPNKPKRCTGELLCERLRAVVTATEKALFDLKYIEMSTKEDVNLSGELREALGADNPRWPERLPKDVQTDSEDKPINPNPLLARLKWVLGSSDRLHLIKDAVKDTERNSVPVFGAALKAVQLANTANPMEDLRYVCAVLATKKEELITKLNKSQSEMSFRDRWAPLRSKLKMICLLEAYLVRSPKYKALFEGYVSSEDESTDPVKKLKSMYAGDDLTQEGWRERVLNGEGGNGSYLQSVRNDLEALVSDANNSSARFLKPSESLNALLDELKDCNGENISGDACFSFFKRKSDTESVIDMMRAFEVKHDGGESNQLVQAYCSVMTQEAAQAAREQVRGFSRA